MIPQSFLDELLARVDIADVVGRFVQLKKTGANYKGLCPFHQEKSPSFTVSPSKQFFHCFGCGANGTAISFLMRHNGLDFVDAVEEVARMVGLTVPHERSEATQVVSRDEKAKIVDALEQAGRFYQRQLASSPLAKGYVKQRGLSPEIIEQYQIGYSPNEWMGLQEVFPNYGSEILVQAGLVVEREAEEDKPERRYDRFRHRLMFPIRNVSGQTIGFGARVIDQGEPKYLNSPETLVFHKGEELYGLFEGRTAIQQRKLALVVEGYMDVIGLAQAGIHYAVATLGTACTTQHISKLLRHTDNVVFSFDGDEAGRRAARRALDAVLPAVNEKRTVRFLFLPTQHDPDSFVREFGLDAFENELQRALSLSRYMQDCALADDSVDTPEGRARIASRSTQLIGLMPNSALRMQIGSQLAQLVGLNARELLSQSREVETRRPTSNYLPVRRPLPEGPAKQAVKQLVQHPQLWHELSQSQKTLLCQQSDGLGEFCTWLETWVEHHPKPTAGALFEAARTLDHGPRQLIEDAMRADRLPVDTKAETGQDTDAAHSANDQLIDEQNLSYLLCQLEIDDVKQKQNELVKGVWDESAKRQYQLYSQQSQKLTAHMNALHAALNRSNH